ncbi:MAG: hypothetical protein INQ03_04665 [Candidatus Heimdallarchaeota archaeon]|nr:hypothetical protein [Candidatus Heimdallarchaeota archaeon]
MQTISDDYDITNDELQTHVQLPSIILRIVLMLLAVALNAGLILYLMAYRYKLIGLIEYEIAIAIVAAIAIFIIGLMGGKFWIALGYRFSTALYRVYLGDKGGKVFRLFSFFYVKFTDPDAKLYLEGRSKDPKLAHPLNLFKLVFNISISQLSFFMLATAFLARPVVSYLRSLFPQDFFPFISDTNVIIMQNILAMGISVSIMALYIPMNYIMKDSNIRTWNTNDMIIGTPSSTLRSRIDGLVGISAVFSGWSIYLGETNEGLNRFAIELIWIVEGYNLGTVLDYISWLLALLIMAWPLIVPASIYYFSNHQRTVNAFRAEASFRGVPVGVSKVRSPTDVEHTIINEFKSTFKALTNLTE